MLAHVRYWIFAGALVLPFWAQARDCVLAAAKYHGVSETVLRAIAWHESKHNAWAVGKNSNGTLDIGRMQVNTIHLSELAKYGVAPEHLLDPCVSDFVGAWLYAKKVRRHGNTWAAVGAYHSETPHLRDAYARKIHDLVYPQLKR